MDRVSVSDLSLDENNRSLFGGKGDEELWLRGEGRKVEEKEAYVLF